MNRTVFREHCFKILFSTDFYPGDEKDEQLLAYFEQQEEDETDENGNPIWIHVVAFDAFDKQEAIAKMEDCLVNLPQIDEKISGVAEGWRFERMGKVERAILRLAYYEMKYADSVPEKVAINEAVNLAKKFGGEESAGFVNGVLAKLV